MMGCNALRALSYMVALALTLAGLVDGAEAQGFPAAFQVVGVAKDDVLNIRAEPSAASDILGKIGPFAISVEVLSLSEDGKWGRVGLAEGNGWVAMRFLEKTPVLSEAEVPRPFSCFGTEPFWSISLYPRGAEYNSPDTGAIPMEVMSEAVSPQGYLFKLREGPALDRTLIVTRSQCGDGMSDRVFGFSTLMFLEAPDGNGTFAGCCTLEHR